eukprot:12419994-Karenia_brevis.AAC.1
MVLCSMCAPNHSKRCPRSRNEGDNRQGKLTISYPDMSNEMFWSRTMPWLESRRGESYLVAKPSEFTCVLVPYMVNGVDINLAVTT